MANGFIGKDKRAKQISTVWYKFGIGLKKLCQFKQLNMRSITDIYCICFVLNNKMPHLINVLLTSKE